MLLGDMLCLKHKISDRLDVLYILTGQHTIGTLSPDEAALLDNYRAISDERKVNLVDVASALSQRQSTEKKAVDGK